MRTTLDLDKELLEQVTRMTGEKSKTKAVNRVMEEFVRRKQIEKLRSLKGKIDLVDNWRELEELELRDQEN
ncbi:MAG: type II toxin-antitoxin system VapB family antitoxin [Chloroflexi bacterium]|nr:type II toxin-antitoxin system VapB family antitoxin [Chloroflexota bacterium]MCH8194903.1 type II toxin-antitoxin system VapB family antitoxin [Chloroflexota bacterium]